MHSEEGIATFLLLYCIKMHVKKGTIPECYPPISDGNGSTIHNIITQANVFILQRTKWEAANFVSLEKLFQHFSKWN